MAYVGENLLLKEYYLKFNVIVKPVCNDSDGMRTGTKMIVNIARDAIVGSCVKTA